MTGLRFLASVGWPVLDRIRIGSKFAISPHGLGIAIGFMIGAALLTRLAPRHGISVDHINTMILWSLLGTIVGARLAYVITHYSDFNGIGDILAVWRGGISLLGGIAGAIIINVPRMRKLGYGFFRIMDPAVIALALGIGIGRSGDLVIGDHLGKPTSWLLAWTYHGGVVAPPFICANGSCTATLQGGAVETIARTGARLVDASGHVLSQGVGVHQTALYDMIGAWVLFTVLWRLNKRPRRLGILTLTFGLWYGVQRVIEDSLRIDKRFFGLTGSQWTASIVATISALTLVLWAVRRQRGSPPALEEPADTEEEPEPA